MNTIGQYLAARLEQIGLKDYFVVPGDFNLVLLDELLLNANLNMINCCNELNAGYAADGYCRAQGASALVVTYCVGGLSAINAVGGAYAEDLPVIVISGGPNSNSAASHQILHHTTAEHDYSYVRDMFAKVTAKAVIIDDFHTAAYLIDDAIMTALEKQKPVYIEIACNLADYVIPSPQPLTFLQQAKSDELSLHAAIESAAAMLNAAKKPALVTGVKLRPAKAINAMQALIDASGYGFAAMPNAKGFLNEAQDSYMGIYWGSVSSPGCAGVVESCDTYLFAGALCTDYTTVGFSTLINPKKLIEANMDHVVIAGVHFNQVLLADFLAGLSKKLTSNSHSLEMFKRIQGEAELGQATTASAKIRIRNLYAAIEKILDGHTNLVIETGDSWFNGMRLRLPKGTSYEFQMQWGSIGWATGATFGQAVAVQGKRRVISCIGDGSFQLTAQEVANMIRYALNPIIFLINNHGYTIEVQIHDGPYNKIKNWHYSELIKVFNAEDGKAWGCQVQTEAQLAAAIKKALVNPSLSFIEVIIDQDDCNKNLLEWGTKVGMFNSRPPQ
jgi:pyruvate decarboxylase